MREDRRKFVLIRRLGALQTGLTDGVKLNGKKVFG